MSTSADREVLAPSSAGDCRVLPASSLLSLGVLRLCYPLGKLQPKPALITKCFGLEGIFRGHQQCSGQLAVTPSREQILCLQSPAAHAVSRAPAVGHLHRFSGPVRVSPFYVGRAPSCSVDLTARWVLCRLLETASRWQHGYCVWPSLGEGLLQHGHAGGFVGSQVRVH